MESKKSEDLPPVREINDVFLALYRMILRLSTEKHT